LVLMDARFELDLRCFGDVNGFVPESEKVNPRPYLGAMIGPTGFAAVLDLAIPKFVEHRDGVFLAMAFDEAVVDDWFERLPHAADVERVVNHVHLWDVTASGGRNYEDDVARLLDPIAWCWEVALAIAFPARRFEILTDRDGSYGPEITFRTQVDEGGQPGADLGHHGESSQSFE
jgi:hypothetical protein